MKWILGERGPITGQHWRGSWRFPTWDSVVAWSLRSQLYFSPFVLWTLYHRLCPGKVLWDGSTLRNSTSGVILSSSEIAMICSNSRKVVLFPSLQRSWADTCESLFHHVQLVYLENLPKLVSQKEILVCISMLCCWALRVVQTLKICTI